ncbi:MAG: hypothetical protein AAF456_04805 [Planctomycetota bacterium]
MARVRVAGFLMAGIMVAGIRGGWNPWLGSTATLRNRCAASRLTLWSMILSSLMQD